MTVRARAALSKELARSDIKKLLVKSNAVGELQLHVPGREPIFLRSSVNQPSPLWVDLLGSAPLDEWRKNTSLLNAVRLGHITVTVE